MLKKILDVEPENAETSSNESLDLLPENAAEIQGEGDSDFDRDVRGETLPAVVHEEPPKTEKLDAVTAGALQLRYRIFNATNDDVRMATDVNGMTWSSPTTFARSWATRTRRRPLPTTAARYSTARTWWKARTKSARK